MLEHKNRPRILAIDDTPSNLQVLAGALASDFTIQIATSGAIGLALVEKSAPDLILLDVMMPDMDGYEVCRRLKADPHFRTIPVIFLSALGESQAESAGLALGAADYINKPINVEVARQRIHNLLEREQLRKEVEAQRDKLNQLVTELKGAAERLEATVAHRTAELRLAATELLQSEAQERRAIASDLHDDLGQNLAVAKLKLSAIELNDDGSDDCRRCREQLKEVEVMIDRSANSVRSLSTQLSPPVLYQAGLGLALEWLADEMQRHYGLVVNLHVSDIAPLDETTGNALFRIVRELLINAWKHAGVLEATVILSMDPGSGELEITVTDEGVGFDRAQTLKPSRNNSYGLFSIQQRVSFLGGTLRIDSSAGSGTTVMLALPSGLAPIEGRTT
jgi:signal transduction histidine kinase